jgi:rhamnulokinase
MNFTNEGGVGGTFRFLKNIAGLWLLEECRRVWSKKRNRDYEELLAAARNAEAFTALVEPDWNGFLNPPYMPDAIRRFCKQTKQTVPESHGAIVRCILESLALKYRFVLDQLRQLAPEPINRIHIIGGGTKNRLLCQFTSDATGLPVLAGPAEATSVGNIMVQAQAAGCVSSRGEMREVIRRSFKPGVFEPQHTTKWDAAYKRYREILDNSK